jgi:hypothetical protein
MAWGKAGSTTLGSAGDDLDITSMTANDFNQFIIHSIASGSMKHNFRFDDNSGSVYARGRSYNGAGKSNDSSQAQIEYHGDGALDRFEVIYGVNLTGEEKLQIHHCVTQGGSGSGTAPDRSLAVSKAVITDQYTRVDCFNDAAGSFDTGSNITVLGSGMTPAAGVTAIGTNLQDNSLFVEKDTARRYWFTAESTSDVTWNDSTDVGCSISGNTITKTDSNGWSSGIGQTDQEISTSTGGTITMTSNATNTFIGLSNVTSLNQQAKTWFDIKFGFSDEEIIENGAQVTPDSAFSRATSDTMKITISSAGLVKYYVNDTLKHTSTITASGSYFGIFAAYAQNENMTATTTTPYIWTRELYFSDDFSSYADQTSANAAWVPASNVAGRRVNISDDDLDLLNDSGTTNYAVVHDLGANAVSDSKWTLRFSADVTLSSGSNNWCYIGLFNSDQSTGGGDSQNFVAVAFQNDGANTKFWGLAGVGRTVNSGQQEYFAATGNGTLTSTKYYIQLRRLTATSMDINIYTDANYSTLHKSMTMSGSVISLGDLRYIKFANNTTSGSGSIAIVMDDVKFRNGSGVI